jgi:hypothetical protein
MRRKNEEAIKAFDREVVCGKAMPKNKATECNCIKRVSNVGRIQNLSARESGRKVFLKPYADGYVIASCGAAGRIPVHVLVNVLFNDPELRAWKEETLREPQKKLTTDHVNRVKDDNHASNLRWASGSLQRANQRRKLSSSTKTSRPVWSRGRGETEWQWHPSVRAASNATGLTFSRTANVLNGVTKTNRSGVDLRYATPSESHELPGEVWRIVPGTTGSVSNMGRVQPTPHSPRYTPTIKENGRCFSSMSNGGVPQPLGSLVLKAFERAAVDDETCDHIDRNPANNQLSNLRWLSKSAQAHNRGDRSKCSTRGPFATREDIPGEVWRDIVVDEWTKEGTYGCVRRPITK